MSISLACACGRSFRINDALAGRKIRCPSCDKGILVPSAESGTRAGGTSTAIAAGARPKPPPMRAPLDRDDEVERRPPVGSRRRPPVDDDDNDDLPRRSRRPVDDDDDDDLPRPKKKKKRSKKRSSSSGGGFSFAVDPQIVSGLFMMIGAAVWFIVGLNAGYIFFYPPILFVLGIAAIIRGFAGG